MHFMPSNETRAGKGFTNKYIDSESSWFGLHEYVLLFSIYTKKKSAENLLPITIAVYK